jgi:hypothetical protein
MFVERKERSNRLVEIRSIKNRCLEPGVVEHACKPSTWETEAGRLQIRGQLGLHRKTLCKKKKEEGTGGMA